jgi:hypothetical protein
MIEIVSMKTFNARDPDHSAIRKPIETRSNRPPRKMSSSVGWMTSRTLSAVRISADPSMIRSWTSTTRSRPSQLSR